MDISASQISLFVASFGAMGHHLPGMFRAYGDRELFQRFKWRFVLVPPLVFLAYFPLYTYHFGLYRLIILCWATWHGSMQLYGFVRIYDSKVGSTARATANWDWMVCLCGFITPQLFRPDRVSNALQHWYSIGGPWVSPSMLHAARWGCLTISILVVVGFVINHVTQSFKGPKPNPLKLLMLASGIGTWWFAMCVIEDLVIGIALFDICHDVQYNAVVWTHNCRRVKSGSPMNGFMRYVFRRGMVPLYLGLIFAYGAIGFFAPYVQDSTVSMVLYGAIFTSTILHYYMDGFIWKVRETSTQVGLGVTQSAASTSEIRQIRLGRYTHLLKWSPAIVVLGFLFLFDFLDPSLTKAEEDSINQVYVRNLTGNSVLPSRTEEISWLYGRFKEVQNIAASVPDDRAAQLRAAVMLANFGRKDEAMNQLEMVLHRFPNYRDAQIVMGDIHFHRGNLDQASAGYVLALAQSSTRQERSAMNLRLGEVDLLRNDSASAQLRFQEALRDNPELKPSIEETQSSSAYP
jgi:hypothetical protein